MAGNACPAGGENTDVWISFIEDALVFDDVVG